MLQPLAVYAESFTMIVVTLFPTVLLTNKHIYKQSYTQATKNNAIPAVTWTGNESKIMSILNLISSSNKQPTSMQMSTYRSRLNGITKWINSLSKQPLRTQRREQPKISCLRITALLSPFYLPINTQCPFHHEKFHGLQ